MIIIGILSLTKAQDQLFKKQGLLLVEKQGSVITTQKVMKVLYYDGISDTDQTQKSCPTEKQFDFTPIRDKFFQLASRELTKNGYEFIADKEDFSQDESNQSQNKTENNIVSESSSSSSIFTDRGDSVENSMSSFAADTPKNSSSTLLDLLPAADKCSCLKITCLCENVSPMTKITIDLPVKITGEIFITLNFNQKVPELVNKLVSRHNGAIIAIYATTKGQFDLNVLARNLELANMWDEDTYIYFEFKAVDVTKLLISYALSDHFCEESTCSLTDTHDIRISWLPGKAVSRSRRSWFFGLQSQSEVDAKVQASLQTSKEWSLTNQNRISNIDKLIGETDRMVQSQTDTLNDLYLRLCKLSSAAMIQDQMIKIERNIINNVDTMMNILNECSLGRVPAELSFKAILNVCMANMDEHICNNLAHKVRTLMTCKIITIHILPTKYLLNLRIKVPQSFKSDYTLYKPVTIPTFNGGFHHELSKLSSLTILQYKQRPEIVLLTQCDEINGILLCQATQSSDQTSHACIADIINHRETKCWSESYKNDNRGCFVKKFANGLLVSTNTTLEVHAHSPGQTFTSKSTVVNGVDIIQNSLTQSFSIACSGVLVSTTIQEGKTVAIHNHDDFRWNDTLSPQLNSRLETEIALAKDETRSLMINLNETQNAIHGPIGIDTFIPNGTHKHTWTIIGSVLLVIVTAILAVLATFFGWKYCCRCRRVRRTNRGDTRIIIGEQAEPLRPRRPRLDEQRRRPRIYTSEPL